MISKKNLFSIFLLICFSTFSYAQKIEIREIVARGNKYFAQKEYQKARAEYAEALIKEPSYQKAHYNIGEVFYELKDYPQAQSHFSQAAKLSKDKESKAKSLHNLGNALMQQQKYEEAINAYKNALRNEPSDNQTRYNLVLAKKLIKKKPEDNPPDLPKPSEFAKKAKQRADKKATEGEFKKAYTIMNEALSKDSTVLHFKNFMEKLNEIIILDTLK